jgi:putative hemolysin
MEALVGEVATVEDESQPDIVQRPDGSWLVDGSVPIARFKEVARIEAELPGEDAEAYRTLGGLVMMALARVPQVGDRFTAQGVTFEVVDMDQNRVDKLLVTRVRAGDQPSA